MPYTTNPHLPTVRRDAVRLVKYRGWSMRQTARHFGVETSTISRWCELDVTGGWEVIPTRSSRPHHHPAELSAEVIGRIITLRSERNQCAEILHWKLQQESISVSLSSVKRVFRRAGISKYSRWKKWHQYSERPIAETPGILVEIDTIHDGPHENRLYLYTALDVCARWGHAEPSEAISAGRSVRFVRSALSVAPFPFQTMQSDNGPEFTKHFTHQLGLLGIAHRHSRVRKPNDNAHLERFNRTIQEECISRVPRSLSAYRRAIPEWLHYYNTERPHMGLQMQTPTEIIKKCCEAIDL